MNIPEGFVLVPTDSIKAIDMGWAYLDAAREAEPGKNWSFSHPGYRAMLAAAPSPQPAAHLTVPGSLEWDGDNGTHSESNTHGEHGTHSVAREAVRDAIAASLGDSYDCTRVWSAWQVGTMDQDDFSLIADDESRLQEIAEAAIQAYDSAEVNRLRAELECARGDMQQFQRIVDRQRIELTGRDAAIKEFIRIEGMSVQNSSAYKKALTALRSVVEPSCEECGGWGHIENEESAHDCPECGLSVVEQAVEAGVMNAPKPYVAMTEAEADEFLSSFGDGSGNKAKRRIAAIEAAKAESFPCWNCSKAVTVDERAAADGDCPHCGAELDLEDWPTTKSAGGCAYEIGDWQCREGGYLWDAGAGEGYDPEDCTHICPHCRTKDYLEAAKDEAESCSSYSNNGSSGTGLDIWTSSERTAMEANRPEALKAMAELGPVSALDDDEVVICNTQQVNP